MLTEQKLEQQYREPGSYSMLGGYCLCIQDGSGLSNISSGIFEDSDAMDYSID